MKEYRNWIEEQIHTRITGQPTYIGMRAGRACYELRLETGETREYYIDFSSKTIEEA